MAGWRWASASVSGSTCCGSACGGDGARGALRGTYMGAGGGGAAVAAAGEIAEPAEGGRGPVDFRIKVAGQMVRRGIARAASRAS